ncbi:MAG TPA: tRNA (guanosine(46)-N7)-methyltransferase TrmB, partial [Cyclobacteriaceae bacterium]|nr:tRNA (guanosine(46)-N7)-methyltransferase TrmB [Cyclobacteriaceae bacterium]
VAFLRTEILFIESFFEAGEVDEIWLTFPDPRPRIRDIKRRLSSSRYVDMYKKLLQPEGYFRFKTDNTELFNFTLEELGFRNDLIDFEYTHDLYTSSLRQECYDIKTKYEEMFAAKGEKIKYLRFKFRH